MRRRGRAGTSSPSATALSLVGRTGTLITETASAGIDFYISPTGSDSNSGTSTSSPWAITALNTKRAQYAGRTIGLMDGTYDCSSMPNYANDGQDNPYPIFQIPGGSSGARTVVKSVNPRGAHLNLRNGSTRNPRPAIGQYGAAHGAGYVTLDGLHISGGAMWGVAFFGAGSNGRANWKPGVIVQNCWIHDFHLPQTDNEPGVCLNRVIDPIVRNNLFHDITDNSANGYGPCAVMTLSVRGLIFEFNEVYNTRCPIHDKHNDGSDLASDGFVIRYNYFHDFTQYWIIGLDTEYIAQAANDAYQECLIHNNVVVDAIGLWYCKTSSPTRMSVTFYNNTFVHTSTIDSGLMGTMMTTSDLFSAYNNITERNGFSNGGWDIAVNNGAIGVIDFNMYDSAVRFLALSAVGTTDWSGTTYTSLASWVAATVADDNSIQATPDFAMTEGGAADYKLDTGSPGLNAGRVGGLIGGATRHMGAWDGVVTQIGKDW